MRVRTSAVGTVFLLAALGCASDASPADGRDTLTARQRDSVIGASELPGARGVQGALEAADSAAARSARLDSLAREM